MYRLMKTFTSHDVKKGYIGTRLSVLFRPLLTFLAAAILYFENFDFL